MQNQLIPYLQQQIMTTDQRLKRFTHSLAGDAYPRRFLTEKLKNYLNDFLSKKSANNMIIMPGFRGVGKTTLMAQICAEYKSKGKTVLFLSLEDVHNLFAAGISELMSAYEEILGANLESLTDPVLIFLDEIQTDSKWAITLKSLYERTSNIFFFCTGSSALVLQTTTNLARRAIFERMPPISFTEYEVLKNAIYPAKDLGDNIRKAVYFSNDAKEVFENLYDIQANVNQYWSQVSRLDIRDYLSCGSLPFSLMMPNEIAVYDSISLLLDKIIKLDLPTLGRFDVETLDSVKRILFAIAENDVTGFSKLEKMFGINRLTIASIFDALEKAELLIKVPAYGSNMTIAKKPHKYLFITPPIRMSFFYFTGLATTYFIRQGKLFEDSVGSQLYREFILSNQGAFRYDSSQGGADFILQIANRRQIIIEVDMGNKDKGQILHSMKNIDADYGLVFSKSELQINHDKNMVFVPYDFYLLM